GLVGMNSALDVAKKINDSIPPKNQINIHVKKMHIRGSQVTLEGVLGSDKDNSLLQSRLVGVASDGKVTPRQPSIPGEVGKVSFAYTFKVDRNVKVSK
ncbi:MAG: pilus assembly protein PilM, partial [Pseudobdellovibrionaceae bacterium]